jgi:hypothetical protein
MREALQAATAADTTELAPASGRATAESLANALEDADRR